MKRFVFGLVMCLSLGKLSAALPPFTESKREIEAILSNQEIYHYIPSGDIIQQIVKTPAGYLIITNNRIVPVSIRYVSRRNLGPARFAIRFHKPIETGANQPGASEEDERDDIRSNRRSYSQSE